MQSAKLPDNESQRIKALHDLAILDTAPEYLYDDITELASQICDAPICLVSLVDSDRQWFKSKHGLGATQTPREMAFCAHAILGTELFEIEDSSKDIRFFDNPLVTDAPNVIFYAGIPLNIGQGSEAVNIGTLCVIDQKPKKLTDKQKTALRCLANQVESNLRLRRANVELERAMKAKSSFLATMSHEIRTPMNGIVGLTNLLIGSSEDKNTIESLNIIKDCSDILLTLLNDILDFSKIESGKISFENHDFSLQNAIRNAMEVLNPLAKKKGLELKVEIDPGLDWINGDSTRLSQILMNLLGNAIKFTEKGSVSLRVKSIKGSQNKLALTFAVQDQGIGIPKGAQESLFKPFAQVDPSTTRKYGGTGLGLAIVKGLVEGMGGKLHLESEEGKGSTFSFSVEYLTATAPPNVQNNSSNKLIEAKANLATENPLTILVAEDNRVNQIVIQKLLNKMGYTSDLAANGLEVLQMVKIKKYDVILMDCQMPEMDGFEATEKINSLFGPEDRPVIYALTAGVMEPERARCLAVGMKKVLLKPIAPENLREALMECHPQKV